MSANSNQYTVGKDQLYFFFRFVILPWELEWANQKFLLREGDFAKFCQEKNIDVKSFSSAAKLSEALAAAYESDAKRFSGLFWFVRIDTKPKDTLRQLRNCFAHGSYIKRQKNRVQCLVIENIDKGSIKAKGFLPLGSLKGFVGAARPRGRG